MTGLRPRLGLAALCVICLVSFLRSDAGTSALWWDLDWGDQATVGLGKVGFAVWREDDLASRTVATGPTDVLMLGLTTADQTAALSGGLALPIQVELRADAEASMTFTVTLPPFDPDTVFGGSDVRLFPVADAADCTVANAPPDPSDLTDIPGIPTTYAPVKQTTLQLCLTAVWDTANDGAYANTATVTGDDAQGQAIPAAEATWTAVLRPQPVADGTLIGIYRNTATVTGVSALGTALGPASASWSAILRDAPLDDPETTMSFTHTVTVRTPSGAPS